MKPSAETKKISFPAHVIEFAGIKTGETVVATPPPMGTRFREPSPVKKATCCPSGENVGLVAFLCPCVPESGVASKPDNGRT